MQYDAISYVEVLSVSNNDEQQKDTGQKQRVALARAVYHRQGSLVLLDDVFSALDAHTSRHILCLGVNSVVRGPNLWENCWGQMGLEKQDTLRFWKAVQR